MWKSKVCCLLYTKPGVANLFHKWAEIKTLKAKQAKICLPQSFRVHTAQVPESSSKYTTKRYKPVFYQIQAKLHLNILMNNTTGTNGDYLS